MAGCKNTATIHFDELATCYLFDSEPTGAPHTTTPSGNGLFVIYRVTSIDNTNSGARDCNFTPATVNGLQVSAASGAEGPVSNIRDWRFGLAIPACLRLRHLKAVAASHCGLTVSGVPAAPA